MYIAIWQNPYIAHLHCAPCTCALVQGYLQDYIEMELLIAIPEIGL